MSDDRGPCCLVPPCGGAGPLSPVTVTPVAPAILSLTLLMLGGGPAFLFLESNSSHFPPPLPILPSPFIHSMGTRHDRRGISVAALDHSLHVHGSHASHRQPTITCAHYKSAP